MDLKIVILSLVFFPFILLKSIKPNSGPEKFEKYFCNVSHYPSETEVHFFELFYIDQKKELGVAKQFRDHVYGTFHIVDDKYHSYFIIDDMKCSWDEIGFNTIDILGFLYDAIEDHLGKDDCGLEVKCEVWSLKSGRTYYTREDNNYPVQVLHGSNLLFSWNAFKKDFDEELAFRLPVPKEKCT